MCWKFLLSISVVYLLQSGSTNAQVAFCDNEKAIDSAIHRIYRFHYTSDDWQTACDSLLSICPKLDQVWQMKAMPNAKLGNWEACYKPLKNAVALNPKKWLSYQAFLKCVFTKDYEGAIIDFKEADKLAAGSGVMDHSFDFYLGLCYLRLDSLPAALKYFNADASYQEHRKGKGNVHPVSMFYLGICHLEMKHYALAEKCFNNCLKVYANYPEPNFYIAKQYILTNKKVLAKAYFVRAKKCLNEGYTSGEDQEYYVNYPYEITVSDIDEALQALNN